MLGHAEKGFRCQDRELITLDFPSLWKVPAPHTIVGYLRPHSVSGLGFSFGGLGSSAKGLGLGAEGLGLARWSHRATLQYSGNV